MPGFEITTEESHGFDEHGYRTHSIRGFIKLNESVEPLLKKLRGAPLSFFICVSAHEPSVCKNGKAPYTRSDVERITGFSERAIQYAAKMLTSLNFVSVCGTAENGEKQYRPTGEYAWFGGDRGAKSAPQEDECARGAKVAPARGVQKGARRGAKNDTPRRVSCSRGVQKTSHDDDVINNSKSEDKNIIIHDLQKAREIFAAVGFQGPWLEDVARVPAPLERAQVWADWVAKAKEAPDQYRSPFGYVHKVYCADPMAEPPEIQEKQSKKWYAGMEEFVNR